MFKSNKKWKNQLFAMMPTIEQSGMGVALIVLEENKKNVKGLKFIVNGHDTFSLSVKDFQKLLDSNKIAPADTNPPDDVLTELTEIYLQCKQKKV
jgi:hypothetical protein